MRSKATRRSSFVASAALLALASGCSGYQHFPWLNTQRWPAPMEARNDPLPAGEAARFPPGPEQVRVIRHADPVQVRTAGSAASFPLSHQRKEVRMSSGSGVSCAAGGRAEVLWEDGGSVILYGLTSGIIGSPSRGEPSFLLRDLERARFDPQNEDLYELLGGVQLRARSGPVRVARVRGDILRIANQSKRAAQVGFRDEAIVLDPGQAVDLPLLSSGGQPWKEETVLGPTQGPGFAAFHTAGTEVSDQAGALLAAGPGVVRALGVRVKLAAGDEARFSGLSRTKPESPPHPAEPPAQPR